LKIQNLHNWDITPKEAIALQQKLSNNVLQCKFDKKIHTAAGLDCAFTKDKKNVIACIVVQSAADFEIIESAYSIIPAKFPYIPGLLSFREAPACLAAAEKLKTTPDIIIVDGQGIAHPRRFGIACHIGLFLDIPAIGCAKSRLIGEFDAPAGEKGASSPLTDKGEIIGSVLRTKNNVKPVYVSVGHKCRLEDAVRIVLECCGKYRIPEPSRIAHQTAAKLKISVVH